jgi:hypothetical protein
MPQEPIVEHPDGGECRREAKGRACSAGGTQWQQPRYSPDAYCNKLQATRQDGTTGPVHFSYFISMAKRWEAILGLADNVFLFEPDSQAKLSCYFSSRRTRV